MTEKLQLSNLDSIGDGNMSWSWPGELKSLSEGRISSTKTEADEVDTQQQHRLEIAEQIEQNGSNEPPPNHDNKVVKRDTENSSSKKRKKLASKSFKRRMLKSKVWKEFEKCKGDDGTELATCRHCKKKFDGSSKKGTTHLNNHLKRCKARKSKEVAGDQSVKAKPVIDQDLKQLDVRRTVIKYWASSLNDMRNHIMEVFKEEKEKVYKCLDRQQQHRLDMAMDSSLSNNKNSAKHQHPAPEQEMIEVVEHVYGNEENNNKRRKRESKVWEEMTKYKGEDGKVWAKCIHCEKVFDGSSKKGTTHLKNHLERCRRKRYGGEHLDKSMKTSDAIGEKSLIDLVKSWFDEHGVPTEHWDPSVLNSRKVDILQIYEEEKEKRRRFFSQFSGRFSSRIEVIDGYSLLTVHYIDENWEPNSKIISFLHGIYDCRSVMATLRELFSDGKINGNICAEISSYEYYEEEGYAGNVTDDVIRAINGWFTQQGSLPFDGFLALMDGRFDSCIHTSLRETSREIRKCVDYVNKMPYNQDEFHIAVDNVKSMGKKVSSEPLPKNGLFLVNLEIPLGYKEAFCELEQIDPDFKTINLTKEKWDEATVAWELKNLINNFYSSFETNSTLPNMYFSKFCDFYVKLLLAERRVGYHLGQNTSHWIETFASIKQKFVDKYWSKYNLVLVITVILDPRFKMEIVQLYYNKIYGCDSDSYLAKIFSEFEHVYNEYAKDMKRFSISYLDAIGRPCTSSYNLISPKSELDRYLRESKFPAIEKFDILAWWRLYSPIFPTLARMARDFLAIPISFDVSNCWGKRVNCIIDDSKLDDDLKLTLICLLGL